MSDHKMRFGVKGDFLKWFTGIKRKETRNFPKRPCWLNTKDYCTVYYRMNQSSIKFVGVDYEQRP